MAVAARRRRRRLSRGVLACSHAYDAPVLTGGWRGRALVLVLCVLVAGCAQRPDAAAAVTLVFKHAKSLGPSDPVPALLREIEGRQPSVHVQAESLSSNSNQHIQSFVTKLDGSRSDCTVLM